MTFRRTTLVDLEKHFPEFSASAEVGSADLLIVVNGFEERTTRFVQLLAEAGASVTRAAIMRFDTNRDDNEALLGELVGGLDKIGSEHTFVDVADIETGLASVVREEQAQTDGVLRVTFDVSGASGRIILRVIRCLFEMARSNKASIDLTVTYTEATDYKPTREEAEAVLTQLQNEAARVESGVMDDPVSVGPDWDADEEGSDVEYTGQSGEGLPERAVVICGFNANRVRVALDAVDPAFNADVPHPYVTYIAGSPPSTEIAWRLDVMKRINTYGANPDQFTFTTVSTLEYKRTLDALEAIYEQGFGAQRITIIPFGSKMQSLAAALFCELHPDVRAQLVAPKRYAGKDYSTGCGPTHTLHFGDLSLLAQIMDSLGELTIEPRPGALTGWSTSGSAAE